MTHETTHDASTASDKGVSNEELTDAIEELEYRVCRLEYELGIEEEDGDGGDHPREPIALAYDDAGGGELIARLYSPEAAAVCNDAWHIRVEVLDERYFDTPAGEVTP